MKLAISNIAWEPDEDEAVFRLMQEYSVTGVEIAPTKIWKDPTRASDKQVADYVRYWHDRGIAISSMQALLFGRPDLTIFESPEKRKATLDYLREIIRLGGQLGANALVFGSPKNRSVGDMPRSNAEEIAVEFFHALGVEAARNDTVFCIEPNPEQYGCDFVTTSREGRNLVARVNHPGFCLHLDAAGMTMSNENIEEELAESVPGICHFHISEPGLKPVGTGNVEHALFARILNMQGYSRWYSIEMVSQDGEDNVSVIEKALSSVKQNYCQ
jgi:sugar phosphate isomerase/epimerase